MYRHTDPIRRSGWLVVSMLLFVRGAQGARVAHEGFPNPAGVSGALVAGGHVPTALTALQVEGGALVAGGYDVFVIGRSTVSAGASGAYVTAVAVYVNGGGNIVTELGGAGMFLSAYSSDVRPAGVRLTPQLRVFPAILHAGGFHASGTPVRMKALDHPVVAGVPDPLAEPSGEDYFSWIETADPGLRTLGVFIGSGNSGFPLGQELPCLVAGSYGHSSFVFATWDWSDSIAAGASKNRILFVNAVSFAALGANRAPAVEIAGPASLECGGRTTTAYLDGTRSSDPDGDQLAFSWTADSSAVTFDDPASPAPRLMADTSVGCGLSFTVTLSADDGRETASRSMGIVIDDTLRPLLSLKGPGTMVLERHRDAYIEAGAAAEDSCDPSVSAVIGGDRVDTAAPGTYVVSYDARDRCGNAAERIFRTVVVEETVPPGFSGIPGDLSVECAGPAGVPRTHPEVQGWLEAPRPNEGCDPAAGVLDDAPSSFPIGDTLVTWTARDFSGGAVTARGMVRVTDSAKPVMVAPADVTLECPAVTDPDATGYAGAVDRCGEAAVTHEDLFEPACGSTGTLVRTWIAVDPSGNEARAVQRIQLVDGRPPAIVLAGPGHLVLEAGVDAYVEAGATGADGCDGEVEVSIGGDRIETSRPGTYAVAYDAVDRCGNRAVRAFRTIEVRDTIPPAFVALPNDLQVERSGPEGTGIDHPDIAAFLAAPRASDLCAGDVRIAHDAPAVFPSGDTLVTWTARDPMGNPVSASRMVHVVDTTPPALRCPADVLAEAPDDAGVDRNGRAEANDASSEVDVSWSDAVAPGCGGTATVVRTWRALDEAGNEATCVQTIRIIDTVPPAVSARVEPLDKGRTFRVRFAAADAGGVTALSAEIVTDCRAIPVADGATVQLSGLDFSCLAGENHPWTARLEVRAEDGCGNRSSAAVPVPFHPDVEEVPQAAFLRGDADLDGRIRMGDPVRILKIALGRADRGRCPDAADANDDGRIGVDDAVHLILVLTRGGRLPAPFPRAGLDPTADSLGCAVEEAPAPVKGKGCPKKAKG